MFIDKNGNVYFGDMKQGDREATQEEIQDYEAKKYNDYINSLELTPYELSIWLFDNKGIEDDRIIELLKDDKRGLIAFKKASYIKRNHPLVISLGQALGMTAEEIDNMFINGKEL